ncbi:hypothetical protein NDU88_008017 [Pleurodeles waltl]|uniref:Uncharacterized protein n=1 Tax=Pleurodeles waltl TaxID=8319 RepID=A0AAV7QMI7_PLEWA|nr:hypothetical protein NDU88_008017 [Pleurodeles waltl]
MSALRWTAIFAYTDWGRQRFWCSEAPSPCAHVHVAGPHSAAPQQPVKPFQSQDTCRPAARRASPTSLDIFKEELLAAVR